MPAFAAPDPRNCVLPRGEFIFDRIDTAGLLTGYRSLGNIISGQVTPEIEEDELPDRLTADGGIYVKATTDKGARITVEITEKARKVMALALLGDEATVALQAAGGPTIDQVIAAEPKKGVIYQLPHLDISGLGDVKQGATPLVEGTDYRIKDAKRGLIELMETSLTIVENTTPITGDYSHGAVPARNRVRMLNQDIVEGKLRFIDRSKKGPRWDIVWYRVALLPQDAFALISDTFWRSTLSFDVLSDADGNYGGSAADPFGYAEEQPAGF